MMRFNCNPAEVNSSNSPAARLRPPSVIASISMSRNFAGLGPTPSSTINSQIQDPAVWHLALDVTDDPAQRSSLLPGCASDRCRWDAVEETSGFRSRPLCETVQIGCNRSPQRGEEHAANVGVPSREGTEQTRSRRRRKGWQCRRSCSASSIAERLCIAYWKVGASSACPLSNSKSSGTLQGYRGETQWPPASAKRVVSNRNQVRFSVSSM